MPVVVVPLTGMIDVTVLPLTYLSRNQKYQARQVLLLTTTSSPPYWYLVSPIWMLRTVLYDDDNLP